VQPNHYIVRDANKQQLAYVYFENEPGRLRRSWPAVAELQQSEQIGLRLPIGPLQSHNLQSEFDRPGGGFEGKG
jgi:hypothetical protein